MAEGSIVTFYSYKGGVGRTLALANIGALLCRWGYKVLCVDWDLEAPGLHLYFERWIESGQTPAAPDAPPGLTELIQTHVDGQSPNWRKFVTEVRFPQTNQPLLLMTAGRQDQSYVERMQALDWPKLYEEQQLGNFLETLRTEWKQEFDFVLIDSRTGITDIGGICTVQMPDFLVLLFTANLQSLRGSLKVVELARKRQQSLPFDRAKLLVLPVATRFEMRVEYELAQQWLKTFADELRPLYADWSHKDVTAEELLNFTRVPYIPYWSFGEKLPVIDKGTDDAEDIGFSLETLTALVAQQFSNSDELVQARDTFIARVKPNTVRLINGSNIPRDLKTVVFEKEKKRYQLLLTAYELFTEKQNSWLPRSELTKRSGLSDKDSDEAQDYLCDEKLLEQKTMGVNGFIEITHLGIVEIEQSIKRPDSATSHFQIPVIQQVTQHFHSNVGLVQTGNQAISNATQNIGDNIKP